MTDDARVVDMQKALMGAAETLRGFSRFEAGRDEDGSLGPSEPHTFDTMALVASDLIFGALRDIEAALAGEQKPALTVFINGEAVQWTRATISGADVREACLPPYAIRDNCGVWLDGGSDSEDRRIANDEHIPVRDRMRFFSGPLHTTQGSASNERSPGTASPLEHATRLLRSLREEIEPVSGETAALCGAVDFFLQTGEVPDNVKATDDVEPVVDVPADTVPRSRYDACNADWQAEKARRESLEIENRNLRGTLEWARERIYPFVLREAGPKPIALERLVTLLIAAYQEADRQPKMDVQRYESIGYQYRFPSSWGEGWVWRDSPSGYNGHTYDASREIFARATDDAPKGQIP